MKTLSVCTWNPSMVFKSVLKYGHLTPSPSLTFEELSFAYKKRESVFHYDDRLICRFERQFTGGFRVLPWSYRPSGAEEMPTQNFLNISNIAPGNDKNLVPIFANSVELPTYLFVRDIVFLPQLQVQLPSPLSVQSPDTSHRGRIGFLIRILVTVNINRCFAVMSLLIGPQGIVVERWHLIGGNHRRLIGHFAR